MGFGICATFSTEAAQLHCRYVDATSIMLRPQLTYPGWCCCLGWVTGNPAAAQLTSTLIQGLVLLKNENANISTLWQTTLLIMVFLVIACSFNIWLARTLPMAEGIFLMLHIFGFFAFLLVLWIMSDHAPAADVFTKFDDLGGWGNKGLSTLVGITTPLWCFLCPDAGAHMAEELKDAGSVLPKAMVWSTAVNAFFGLVMIITLCFCIGDIEAVLDSPTGYPIIQVLYNSTGSYSGTVVMTVLLLILSLVGTITCVAATSRQMWAFARDKGFPFSSYIERVRFLLPCPPLQNGLTNAEKYRSNQAGTSPSTPSSPSSASPCSLPASISVPTSPLAPSSPSATPPFSSPTSVLSAVFV